MSIDALIILVNWKRAGDTLACLASLEHLQGASWHAVVCENGSPDASLDELRQGLAARHHERRLTLQGSEGPLTAWAYELSEGRRITLVASPSNLGFAGGNNLALNAVTGGSYAAYDYYWFLNNDTLVRPDTLALMLRRMRADPLIGICGATLLYEQMRERVQALGGACYAPWTGLLHEVGQGSRWPQTVDQAAVEKRLDYISGASMLVSASFLNQVGTMAEDYFLYYEELDWAERARRFGYTLAWVSDAIVYHKEGAVLGSGKSSKRSALAEYYGLKNKLRITRRFFPYALPSVWLISLLQVLRRLLQGQWARALMMVNVLLGQDSRARRMALGERASPR